jgi:hypothetical protein
MDRALATSALAGLFAAVWAGCKAPTYQSTGPDPEAEPPRTILVRVVALEGASEPESISVDGTPLCSNYDPVRQRLPRCPAFGAGGEGQPPSFELQTYVSVGEHRIGVNGWGYGYTIKTDGVFMPGTVTTCAFDFDSMVCMGGLDADPFAGLEASGDQAAAEPATSDPASVE